VLEHTTPYGHDPYSLVASYNYTVRLQ